MSDELKRKAAGILAALQKSRPCSLCGDEARGIGVALCARCLRDRDVADWAKKSSAAILRVRNTAPRDFRELSIHDSEQLFVRELWERCPSVRLKGRSYVIDPRVADDVAAARGAILQGESGAGKSSLGCAMLYEHARRLCGRLDDELAADPDLQQFLLERAESCLYLSALDVPGARLAHGAGKGDPPILLEALHAPVLLVDGLGEEDRSGDMVRLLTQRIDDRRTTIVTTSLNGDDVVARYGEGVYRRLFQRNPLYELELPK